MEEMGRENKDKSVTRKNRYSYNNIIRKWNKRLSSQ